MTFSAEEKWCRNCSRFHPLTEEFWQTNGKDKNGKVQYICRETRKRRDLSRRKEINEKAKAYRDNNPEKFKKYRDTHYAKNKEKVIQRNWDYQRRRKSEDICYNLAIKLRQRLGKAVKQGWKTGSAVADLGCSIEEFKRYIESLWQEGMTWDNYGKDGWHLDHIKPLSMFNLEEREQMLLAVHYTNIQPLWALENIKKSNKIITV